MAVRMGVGLPGPFFLTFGFRGIARGTGGVIMFFFWILVIPLVVMVQILIWIGCAVAWLIRQFVNSRVREQRRRERDKLAKEAWDKYYTDLATWNAQHPQSSQQGQSPNVWSDRR